ncbi:hypothetical protein HF319_00730 [Xanthomonas sp. Kuri4-1]
MFKVFLGFSLFATSLGVSAAIPISCDSCQTDADFRARAIHEEAITNRGGTYWVYSLPNNLVQKWTIRASSGGGGGTVPRVALAKATAAAASNATKQPTEAAIVEEVNAGHNLYVSGRGTTRPLYYVPFSHLNIPDTNKSVYNILRDYNLKAQIESKFGDLDIIRSIVKADVLTSMTNLLQVATNFAKLKDQARIIFRLVMDDGSYIDLFLNPLDTTADTQENTARTAKGQLIPENSQQLQGTWSSDNGDNLTGMVEHAGALGASIEYVSEGNFITTISCIPQRCTVERHMR